MVLRVNFRTPLMYPGYSRSWYWCFKVFWFIHALWGACLPYSGVGDGQRLTFAFRRVYCSQNFATEPNINSSYGEKALIFWRESRYARGVNWWWRWIVRYSWLIVRYHWEKRYFFMILQVLPACRDEFFTEDCFKMDVMQCELDIWVLLLSFQMSQCLWDNGAFWNYVPRAHTWVVGTPDEIFFLLESFALKRLLVLRIFLLSCIAS